MARTLLPSPIAPFDNCNVLLVMWSPDIDHVPIVRDEIFILSAFRIYLIYIKEKNNIVTAAMYKKGERWALAAASDLCRVKGAAQVMQ